MKTVLLQMEDEAYEMLMKKIQKIADAEEFCLDSAELQNIAYLFLALVEKTKSLDNLTNGEVAEKVFNKSFDDWYGDDVEHYGMATIGKDYPDIICSSGWFYRKWGE